MPSSIYGSKWSRMFQLIPFASKKIRCTKFFLEEFWSNFVRSLGPFQRFFHLLASIDFQIPPNRMGRWLFVATKLWWGHPYQLSISPSNAPFFGFQGFLGQPQPPTENHQPFNVKLELKWTRGAAFIGLPVLWPLAPWRGDNLEAFRNFWWDPSVHSHVSLESENSNVQRTL